MCTRRELVFDTDAVTFGVFVVAGVLLFLRLGFDVYRWSRGVWLEPVHRPAAPLDWFTFLLTLAVFSWAAVACRDKSMRLFRFACGFLAVSWLLEGVLFWVAPTDPLAVTIIYLRPAVSAASLVLLLLWLVAFLRSKVVHV